jgi:hypothetical protein
MDEKLQQPPATDPHHDLNQPPNTDPKAWLVFLLSPSPQTFLITFLAILLLPPLGHFVFFRQKRSKTTPTVLLLGPANAGKTALLTSVTSLLPSPQMYG